MYDIPYMQKIFKMIQMNLQNRNTLTLRKQTYGYQMKKVG